MMTDAVQFRATQMPSIARNLKRQVPSHVVALVGPPRTYPKDGEDIWNIMIVTGERSRVGDNCVTGLSLEAECAQPPEDEWTRAVDTVLWLRPADSLTYGEACEVRDALLGSLRKHFQVVEVFDTDAEILTAYHARYPSEKSARMLRVCQEKNRLVINGS